MTWVRLLYCVPTWSGGHVNLSTGWLETVYGCHAYPKKTPNTRGGDYQTPPSYLGSGDSGWKIGVLQFDTATLSTVITYR